MNIPETTTNQLLYQPGLSQLTIRINRKAGVLEIFPTASQRKIIAEYIRMQVQSDKITFLHQLGEHHSELQPRSPRNGVLAMVEVGQCFSITDD